MPLSDEFAGSYDLLFPITETILFNSHSALAGIERYVLRIQRNCRLDISALTIFSILYYIGYSHLLLTWDDQIDSGLVR